MPAPTDSDWVAYAGSTSTAWWSSLLAALWANDVGALPRRPIVPKVPPGAFDDFFRKIAGLYDYVRTLLPVPGPPAGP